MNYEQPDYYKLDGVDVPTIDVIKGALGYEGFLDFCHGNILKYAIRANKKGFFIADIKKIKVYAQWIIDAMEEIEQ